MAEIGVGGRGLAWATAVGIFGCGPDVAGGAENADSTGPGSSSEASSTAVDESSSSDGEPPLELPTRLLMRRATPEGGTVLEFVELGADAEFLSRPLHPELDNSILVDDFEVLAGTGLVAFRARLSEDAPAQLYVARADAGAPGSAIEIDVDGDVEELAWVRGASTLVVATSSATYRVEMTASAAGQAVEIVGPATPADVRAIDAVGMRIAADFSATGEPSTCWIASVDPGAPTEWIDAYEGPDAECLVDGFGPDAVVFSTGGDSPPFSLWRRAFVDGVLQEPVLLTASADNAVHVAPHGVVYRTDGSARELFYVAAEGEVIGEPQRLSTAGLDINFTLSKNGRQLVFAEDGVTKLVDLDRANVAVLSLTPPSPYTGTGGFVALSPDGLGAYVVGNDPDETSWAETKSLWRFDISSGIAADPVLITETSPTSDDENPSSIKAIDLAPDGSAIAYSRHEASFNGVVSGDVASAELGPLGVTETVAMAEEPVSRVAYSPDGEWLAFGEVELRARAGGGGFGASALEWAWWEPGE